MVFSPPVALCVTSVFLCEIALLLHREAPRLAEFHRDTRNLAGSLAPPSGIFLPYKKKLICCVLPVMLSNSYA